jgi:hypothetical protein
MSKKPTSSETSCASHCYRADLEGRLPIVYNGKSAEEWYTLYCQLVLRYNELADHYEKQSETKMTEKPNNQTQDGNDCGSSDCYLVESIIKELEYQKHMSFDYGKRATMGSLASRLRVFDKKVRIALADSIRRPMGVVPVSAEGLVSDEDLIDAEKRRTGVRVD